MSIQIIEGGVCAPKGFLANGIHDVDKKDGVYSAPSLICSKKLANAAAILSSNKVKSDSLLLSKKNIENGRASAILLTRGSANACVKGGYEAACELASALGGALKISPRNVMISSSGDVGVPLDVASISDAIPELASGVGCCYGITKKECAVSFEIDGKLCRMGGIAAGDGQTVAIITTDCAISSEMLSLALAADAQNTLELVSFDGRCTPSDTIMALANGMAKNKEITKRGKDFIEFAKALNVINLILARKIAADTTSGTKLIECSVVGARNDTVAKAIAKGVVSAPYVKSDVRSATPVWGHIISAVGAVGVELNPQKIDVSLISDSGEIPVCSCGVGVNFSEEFAREVLSQKEITIAIKLSDGVGEATAWGSDKS
ncbi:MAG: bifunctional ornithine acetyltransferase/N-acetylglutamate synthase [Clostridia bacterium]|nr:bifunctional ornithine acetyltransferase/N-acetylglutamate synthase [Clostridia bacterium]